MGIILLPMVATQLWPVHLAVCKRRGPVTLMNPPRKAPGGDSEVADRARELEASPDKVPGRGQERTHS